MWVAVREWVGSGVLVRDADATAMRVLDDVSVEPGVREDVHVLVVEGTGLEVRDGVGVTDAEGVTDALPVTLELPVPVWLGLALPVLLDETDAV